MLYTENFPVLKNINQDCKYCYWSKLRRWEKSWKSFLAGLRNWPHSQRGRMAVSWMFCCFWLLDVLVGCTRGHSLFSCEPIILRMCQDLPYNTTFMPNLLNHYDQQTAALAMEVRLYIFFLQHVWFWPLIDRWFKTWAKKILTLEIKNEKHLYR